MVAGRIPAYVVLLLSGVLSFALMMMPMPEWFVWLRPNWVLLVMIFWGLALPQRVGVMAAWVVGILVDLCLGSLLGLHAFCFVSIQYLVVKFRPQLQHYSFVQLWLAVLLALYLNQLMMFSIQGFAHHLPVRYSYWLQPLVGALFWPWLEMVLRFFQWRYRIHYHTEL